MWCVDVSVLLLFVDVLCLRMRVFCVRFLCFSECGWVVCRVGVCIATCVVVCVGFLFVWALFVLFFSFFR